VIAKLCLKQISLVNDDQLGFHHRLCLLARLNLKSPRRVLVLFPLVLYSYFLAHMPQAFTQGMAVIGVPTGFHGFLSDMMGVNINWSGVDMFILDLKSWFLGNVVQQLGGLTPIAPQLRPRDPTNLYT
jgi:hypothetical protein